MLTEIIIVLLWVVPVVIHAVVVSRKKRSLWYHAANRELNFTIDPYDGASGSPWWSYDELWLFEQFIYAPDHKRWRTHHGMIDLHYERMRRKDIQFIKDHPFPYFQPSWADKVDKYGNLPDWTNANHFDTIKKLNTKLFNVTEENQGDPQGISDTTKRNLSIHYPKKPDDGKS